jgi:hypothetical protein
LRLRPILMTTAATVVAMIPLLIAGGAGAASRFAIGVVIAAGMTIGTLFTLFVTPAVYTFLARDHQRTKARAQSAESATSQPAAETLAEAEQAAEAGMVFPVEGDPVTPEAQPSPEAHAFAKAAAAAASGQGHERRAAKRHGRRRRYPPAAE